MFTVICFCFTRWRKKNIYISLWAFEIFNMKIKHNNFTACGAVVGFFLKKGNTHTHTPFPLYSQVFQMDATGQACCRYPNINSLGQTRASVLWGYHGEQCRDLHSSSGEDTPGTLTKVYAQHITSTSSLPLEPHHDVERRPSQAVLVPIQTVRSLPPNT